MEKVFEEELMEGEVKLTYLGFSGIILRTKNYTLLLDPSNLISTGTIRKLKTAKNVITIYTHDHYDHYDETTLKEIYHQIQCPVIVEPAMMGKLSKIIPQEKLYSAQHGKPLNIQEAIITGVKGLHRGPITLYHIEVDGIRIFHGGDSAYVKLEGFKTDIAIIPTGDPSPTASPRDAYKMIIDLKPKIALAIHGSTTQHHEFKNLVEKNIPEVKVTPLSKGEIYKFKI